MSAAELKPHACEVAQPMPNLEDLMQVALYQDRQYIWQYEGHEHLKSYFRHLIGME